MNYKQSAHSMAASSLLWLLSVTRKKGKILSLPNCKGWNRGTVLERASHVQLPGLNASQLGAGMYPEHWGAQAASSTASRSAVRLGYNGEFQASHNYIPRPRLKNKQTNAPFPKPPFKNSQEITDEIANKFNENSLGHWKLGGRWRKWILTITLSF